ncbi:alkylation response protein AidB-like acyl-CoA dehydrogenase [Amycolatopsis echigonensis]|uniref:Alkylation response protein AidB-like acyl-CoA dehydrogenase n=1 Tax=Amycolatopsis echigonensis TaxID=2576905 RepID=A0A2N3W9N8_9PSEU|nr:acyl-CoA dehydrogenase family protein [Amycolatopsis niigatensis]PKV90582.1 alkylation response protein AidB-like acyl-CoA dehydrogenase [Amycolatopsis niigatensis]
MPVALTEEQSALAAAVRDWAAAHDPVGAVRAAEATGASLPEGFTALGLTGIALPASVNGADGTVADLAAGLAAAAEALVPGPLLSTALAGLLLAEHSKELAAEIADGTAQVAVQLEESATVPGAYAESWLLVPRGEQYVLVPPGEAVEPLAPFDFSRPLARVKADVPGEVLDLPDVRDLAATLAVAEAAGVARWCLTTAVEYAKVREQFGQVIGAFQAVKHLCAEMLCRTEAAEALAWDAASAVGDPLAVASAAAVALDAAVENAKDCIQVLGGIGFTWEHEAHLYLRRALALRQWLGGSQRWRKRAANLALAGKRRTLGVEVGEDAEVTRRVAEIAALPEENRRTALADSGLLAPHWPQPYGLGADAATQLRIDAALAAADIRRPDLVIGGWAVPTILAHGTDDQRERFAKPTLRGEVTWCQLFSEPGAGSDLASLRTVARRTDGGWLLTGQKVWTSLAHEADWAICLARTDPEAPKHKGITYFLVDMRAAGITTRPLREITGRSVFNEVFLDDVFVPDADVVGEPGAGWKLARTTLANERVALGRGSAVGETVEALLESAPADVDRDRLGALIGQGSACSVLDLRATLRRLDGLGPGAESSVAKLLGVRHRQETAEFALDLEPELVAETPAAQEFLLTRCLSIAGGTTQVLLSAAAERVLGLPR